jgi:hypothetical protein
VRRCRCPCRRPRWFVYVLGGKSVKRPGLKQAGVSDIDDGQGPRLCGFQDTVVEMLEIVSDAIIDLDTLRFRAVDKSGGVAAVRGTV